MFSIEQSAGVSLFGTACIVRIKVAQTVDTCSKLWAGVKNTDAQMHESPAEKVFKHTARCT